MALAVSEEVMEFDQQFRKASHLAVQELEKMTPAAIAQKELEFITHISPAAKAKKLDTMDETKLLFLAGKSLAEIAKERNLTVGTILTHLEKLTLRELDFDLSALEKELPKARIEKIMEALRDSGREEGVYRLTPAKAKLGENVSFDEIRLARLLLDR